MPTIRTEDKRETSEELGRENSMTILDGIDALDERVPARPGHETAKALAHLLVVLSVVSGLAFVPYTSHDFVRFVPWLSEDGVPVARMFRAGEAAPNAMGIATGGAARGARYTPGEDAAENNALANLDDAITEPVTPPAVDRSDPAGPVITIAPSETEGLVLELEDEDRAMDAFYAALVHTALEEEGAITRVAHYGDSSIAGDGITVTLRRRFQQRFGDAGHGFLLIARGTMPWRHQDVTHRFSSNWNLNQLVRAGVRDHHYGYGGVLYRGGIGQYARFATDPDAPVGRSVSRYELYYQAHPRGGRVDFRVDDGERVVLNTRAEEMRDAWHVIEVPDGEHELELRAIGGGESRLYGMVMERDGPGVTYDSLGMVGARARRMHGLDPEHFARQLEHRQVDLVVLAFGGNDADDPRTQEQFENDFRRVARMVRVARPEASCLLMAPLDQARRDVRGRIETLGPVPVIVEAQRAAAQAEGCAFFDTYEAMGGEGSMRRWFRSEPRLAFGDFRHATPAGYRVIGNMFYKAILSGFRAYLEREADQGPAQE